VGKFGGASDKGVEGGSAGLICLCTTNKKCIIDFFNQSTYQLDSCIFSFSSAVDTGRKMGSAGCDVFL
jgi:hypothetical protein